MQLGQMASQRAAAKGSSQNCWKHIAGLIQNFVKIPQKAVPVKNSEDMRDYLEQYDFIETKDKKFKNGDVAVFYENPQLPIGHTEIYFNGNWYSDHKQADIKPTKNAKLRALYRFYTQLQENQGGNLQSMGNQGETTFKVFTSHTVTQGGVSNTKHFEHSGKGFGSNFKPFM